MLTCSSASIDSGKCSNLAFRDLSEAKAIRTLETLAENAQEGKSCTGHRGSDLEKTDVSCFFSKSRQERDCIKFPGALQYYSTWRCQDAGGAFGLKLKKGVIVNSPHVEGPTILALF